MRRLLRIAGILWIAAAACRGPEKAAVATAPTPTPAPPTIAFAEKAAGVGVTFTHVNGAAGKKWMPETMGGGVAVLDYDSDGKPDLLFVSGGSTHYAHFFYGTYGMATVPVAEG